MKKVAFLITSLLLTAFGYSQTIVKTIDSLYIDGSWYQFRGIPGPQGPAGTTTSTASEIPFTPNGSISATNVQDAIQEVRDEANNDFFTGTEITDGYTFTSLDFDSGRRLFWYNGATDIEVNIATDVASLGEKLQLWQYGTGKIQVNIDSSLDGASFATLDNTNPVTLTKQFGNYGYRPIGNWESYAPPPIGFYTTPNVINPNNETNSLAGIIATENCTISSSTDQASIGTYSVMTDQTTAATTTRTNISMTGLTIGQSYTISVDTYRVAPASGNVSIWVMAGQGSATSVGVSIPSATVGSWHTTSLTFTANSTSGQMQYLVPTTATQDITYLDNFIITPN